MVVQQASRLLWVFKVILHPFSHLNLVQTYLLFSFACSLSFKGRSIEIDRSEVQASSPMFLLWDRLPREQGKESLKKQVMAHVQLGVPEDVRRKDANSSH